MCRLHKAATSQCARPSRADHTSLPLQLRSIPALHLACEFRPPPPQEPTKRLSLDLPESKHRRFKTACSATGHKMVQEIEAFIDARTRELEVEAGISRE